ncbi:hypothetical protein FPV16_09920 [Methylobacterium sp. W2]|uniref:hypothetical protein n=1 Tax=Methylobacterium sp. W2 TaxID=2598107 RepID=UPI001D0C9F1E|nr:hypothetical protein [Methylobacterium sp. W2]MCC0806532.1 hypothetical protein [Methylobacterium sp. W2]
MIAAIAPSDFTIRISRTEEIRIGDIKTAGQARLLLVEVQIAISKLERDLADSVCLTASARAWRRRAEDALKAKRASQRRLQVLAASLDREERRQANATVADVEVGNAHARRKAFVAIVTERFPASVVEDVWQEVHRRCPISAETGRIEA